MKTFLMTLGFLKTMFRFLQDVKRIGVERLSPERAQKDRIGLEKTGKAMETGNVYALPRSLRMLCKWLKKLGLLKPIGLYIQTVLKSGKMERNDRVLYRTQ